ncbi:MAG: hypothetical protein S4CHLAM45_00970 [Chlamydiales bacterium]|nr:hypothetical protein [Chlamydiales bacterium]MCH9619418.1 hypothetical protein [Chlamydiales bacterium]MCH9622222.1 hypothetical protein [Chlamydiales bacterium]
MTENEHFGEKEAIAHVVEKQVEGIVALSESHGTEMPGHLSAGADAARETAILLFVLWTLLDATSLKMGMVAAILVSFGLGLLVWKAGRSAWLGWTRLERLHRVIEQERHEIEHNREQEREELTALYAAKGFEGKLLEDVIDVLMSDNDRLLKVMLEEELGLTLQAYEHPLKQCVGAFVGALFALLILAFFFLLLPSYGALLATAITLSIATVVSAVYEKNQVMPALVWNLAIGGIAFGVAYFVMHMFL